MSWEGAVSIFARWPWSLLGLAAGAYAVVVRRGLDFRVTPKGSDAASAAPVGVVIPYIGLSVVSALPAALTADPGTAAGFYAFALLNALIYLGIAILILGMHDHAGHLLKSLAKVDALIKVAVLGAASLFLFTSHARLAPGLDAIVGPTAGLTDSGLLADAKAWLASAFLRSLAEVLRRWPLPKSPSYPLEPMILNASSLHHPRLRSSTSSFPGSIRTPRRFWKTR